MSIFLSVEGIDGSGKGTVMDALEEEIAEVVGEENAVFTREPSPEWTGEQVRRAINKDDSHPMADFHLFVADRAEHLKHKIGPALNEGKIVICDRYKDSTRAYQRDAIEPYVHGMLVDDYIENNMAWAPEPSLTILLDVDVEKSVERTGERDKYEKREFLENVRQNYLDICERAQKSGRNMVKIDASQPEQRVVNKATTEVLDFINERTIR